MKFYEQRMCLTTKEMFFLKMYTAIIFYCTLNIRAEHLWKISIFILWPMKRARP